jgi:hypothetical protein
VSEERESGPAGERGRFTRRRLVVAGVGGAAVVAGFGIWGRFALGDSFERHVAAQLGLDLELTDGLLQRMRDELGDYELRAAAFLVATKDPADAAVPESVRREAIDAFVGPMFGLSRGLVVPLDYAGLRDSPDYVACAVLVR